MNLIFERPSQFVFQFYLPHQKVHGDLSINPQQAYMQDKLSDELKDGNMALL